jgi:hypothetical protein
MTGINSEEQKKLDAMQVIIDKVKVKLEELLAAPESVEYNFWKIHGKYEKSCAEGTLDADRAAHLKGEMQSILKNRSNNMRNLAQPLNRKRLKR